MAGLVATAETEISASPEKVWSALTDPAQIKKYMFGTEVATDWQPGSPITWQGEYEGKPYQGKGELPHVDLRTRARGAGTHLSLSQDNNASDDEVKHSSDNWSAMLTGIKDLVEGS